MGDIAPSERHRYPSFPASLRRLDEGVAVDDRRGVDEELERMLMLYATRIIDSGTMSLAALEALIGGVRLRGGWSSMAAKVFSPNGADIGRRLASVALAYQRYTKDYVNVEDEARRGMWRGTFVKPWVWRASSRPRPAQEPVLSAWRSKVSARLAALMDEAGE